MARWAFSFTYRIQKDLTGAVPRATLDGPMSEVFSGIIDSQVEHQINDIKVGRPGQADVGGGGRGEPQRRAVGDEKPDRPHHHLQGHRADGAQL